MTTDTMVMYTDTSIIITEDKLCEVQSSVDPVVSTHICMELDPSNRGWTQTMQQRSAGHTPSGGGQPSANPLGGQMMLAHMVRKWMAGPPWKMQMSSEATPRSW